MVKWKCQEMEKNMAPPSGNDNYNNMTPPSENDNSNGMMNNGGGNSNNMTPPTSPSQNDNNSSSFNNMSQGIIVQIQKIKIIIRKILMDKWDQMVRQDQTDKVDHLEKEAQETIKVEIRTQLLVVRKKQAF